MNKDVIEDVKRALSKDSKLPEIHTVISMEGQKTFNTVGTCFCGVTLKESDSKDGIDTSNMVMGAFNIESTIAMIQSLYGIQEQLISAIIEHHGKKAVDAILEMSMKREMKKGKN